MVVRFAQCFKCNYSRNLNTRSWVITVTMITVELENLSCIGSVLVFLQVCDLYCGLNQML